jgi:serine/threonine protein phosphatase 1
MGRLFAISDIHGCFDAFYELLIRRIGLDRSDRLILLGDYIDRGEKSKEVIDFIIDLQAKGYNITPLLGNHEAMLMDSYQNPVMLPVWYMNSGMTTLHSFGIRDIADIDKKYTDFFMSLHYFEISGNFIFVHAGFDDYAPDPFADTHSMIWECRTQYDNPALAGKTIIHGHRPKTTDWVKKMINEKSKVIPIDTGCVYDSELGYGNLSALEINSMLLITVKNNYYE